MFPWQHLLVLYSSKYRSWMVHLHSSPHLHLRKLSITQFLKTQSHKHDIMVKFSNKYFTDSIKVYAVYKIIAYFKSLYSKTCLKRPLKKKTKIGFQDQLSLNAGQEYGRMLQREHSAILSTFIKLPFAIKTVICLFLCGCSRRFYCTFIKYFTGDVRRFVADCIPNPVKVFFKM